MKELIDKYFQIIGIFLVLAILAGGGGIVWESQISNLKSQNLKNQKLENPNSKQIQNPPTQTQEKPKPTKININTATQEELESLPGIGKVKAKAIIEYREKYGKFKNEKDIIKVKGIGEKTYEKIKDLIEVN